MAGGDCGLNKSRALRLSFGQRQVYVTTPSDVISIRSEAISSIATEAKPSYQLEAVVDRLIPYVIVFLIASFIWTVVRIGLLTRMPASKVIIGTFCAAIVYVALNVTYSAFIPTHTWVQIPGPCLSGGDKI